MTPAAEMSTPPAREEAAAWTRELTRKFGEETAVSNVSMTLPKGKIFGFIGPSGSGKTTTVRLLTGALRPTSGELEVMGVDPGRFRKRHRADIGYMAQLFVLYPELTVWENLNFVSSLYGVPLRRNKRLHEVLDFVEMDTDRRKLAREISGGMQRRLSLAATLVHKPQLLFLDEPTAGIDPVLRRKFWDHFHELRDNGRTLFVTTQYVSEATYCDLVGVLAEGRLLMVDTPEGLRHRAYGGDIVDLVTKEPLGIRYVRQLRELPFVQGRPRHVAENHVRLVVSEAATDVTELVDWARAQDLEVESVEEYQPPFDDVFVELVKENNIDA
ncbi:MAG: ABC transporter ATP-binding protein [Anaerolineae bacterium]|nr:ABC transporter ATP-binding protein [Anaerolineae bacterium]